MFDNIEKNILDLVTFDDIKISYPVDKDVLVVFTIDPTVRASTRDWVGIYPVGWTAFESCLTYHWGIGRHYENSCRTRYMVFKARDIRKAKCGTHYQFVYVSKYLDVLGVSQYFQFCSTEALTPGRSPSRVHFKFSESNNTRITTKSDSMNSTVSPNCKLALEPQAEVFTSCGKCQSSVNLKETSITLVDKASLSKIVPTPWDEEFERARFQKFLGDICSPFKPDGSGEKTANRLTAIEGLVSAMDEVIAKAVKIKSELLRMIESPDDGEAGLVDPNASGILPVPEEPAQPKGIATEPPKCQEIDEPASGEPSVMQA